jgi:hypothetical protein
VYGSSSKTLSTTQQKCTVVAVSLRYRNSLCVWCMVRVPFIEGGVRRTWGCDGYLRNAPVAVRGLSVRGNKSVAIYFHWQQSLRPHFYTFPYTVTRKISPVAASHNVTLFRAFADTKT